MKEQIIVNWRLVQIRTLTTVFQVLASMQINNYRDASAFNRPLINIINDIIFLCSFLVRYRSQIEKLPLVPTRAPRGPEQFC